MFYLEFILHWQIVDGKESIHISAVVFIILLLETFATLVQTRMHLLARLTVTSSDLSRRKCFIWIPIITSATPQVTGLTFVVLFFGLFMWRPMWPIYKELCVAKLGRFTIQDIAMQSTRVIVDDASQLLKVNLPVHEELEKIPGAFRR